MICLKLVFIFNSSYGPQDHNRSLQCSGMIFLAPVGTGALGENQYWCEKKAPSPGSCWWRGRVFLGFLQGVFLPLLAMVPIRVMWVGTREYVPTNVSTRKHLREHVPGHLGHNHTFIFRACAIKWVATGEKSFTYVNEQLGPELH